MTFGQQPQNNGQYNPQYNTPDYNAAQQSGYGQQYAQSGYGQNYYAQPQGAPTYQYAPQDEAGAGAGAATINTTMTYNYEEARRVSVAKVYGEMTIGILVTAVVAVLGQITGAYYSFLMATGMVGLIGLCVVQIALAVVLGMRVTKMKSATARAADRIRGPGPGNGQEDLHPVCPEPVPRLREHVPVHPAAARQQGLASPADWWAACSLPVKRHSPTTLWPGFFMSVTFAR